MSGRSFTSQGIRPTGGSEPASSSRSATNSKSPRGWKPSRASAAIVTALVTVSFFMSTEPRPHR